MKLTLNLESPYTETGQPRSDLPTGEVLAWDGKEWCNGWLSILPKTKFICLCDGKDRQFIALTTVQRFAVLPTIIEEDGN